MGSQMLGILEWTNSFALRVIRFYPTLPKSVITRVIGKQVLRSEQSVLSAVRKGNSPWSVAAMIRQTVGVLQELEEIMNWLEFLSESGRDA